MQTKMVAAEKGGDPSTKWRFSLKPIDVKLYPPPYLNPWLRLSVYVLMVIMSGCIFWGWSGIQKMLYKAGAFEDLCRDVANPSYISVGKISCIDCGPRKSAINNLFTIAYSSQLISSVFTGILVDFLGPKCCFMIGQATNFVSWVMMSSCPRNHTVLRFCFLFIGFTTESMYIPLTTVSHYFPGNQSFILSVMGSARSFSFVVPVVMAKLFTLDSFEATEFYKIGIFYAVFCNLLCFLFGALIIQYKFRKVADEDDFASRETTADCEGGCFEPKRLEEPEPADEPERPGPLSRLRALWRHRQRNEFIMLAVVTALFLSSVEFVNKSHRDLLTSASGVSAVEVFKYIHVLSFIPGPFLGHLMDRFGSPVVMMLLQGCCLGYLVFALTDIYVLEVLGCLLFLVSISLCISETYCYTRQRFPPAHFGVLNGFCLLTAGLMSLTNIPVYNLAARKLAHMAPNNFMPVVPLYMVSRPNAQVYLLVCICITAVLYRKMRRDKTPAEPEEL